MLPKWYGEYKSFVEKSIKKYLDNYFQENITNKGLKRFKEIVYYSLKGGKKIRPILALEFYLILSGKHLSKIKYSDDIVKFLLSLEFIHAYSLIHDDLPCMDNDEYRRGELTTWKKYSEYEAVLCGDLLNSLAFEVLSEINNKELSIKLINLLSKNVGFNGMIGGQIDDLYFEKNFKDLNLDNLLKLHNKKTGALIMTSILGGILFNENHNQLKIYEDFGKKLGLAFQVKDDLLDVEGTLEETGKSVGGEDKGFVYFMGIKKSRDYLNNLLDECKNITKSLNSEKLDFIIRYVGERKK